MTTSNARGRCLIILALLASLSCSLPGALFAPQPTNAPEPAAGLGGGITQTQAGSVPQELPELASFTFDVDSSRSSSGDYPTDGSELMLSVQDAGGLTWTLRVPPGALDHSEKISMTALMNPASDAFPHGLKGGVMLEPDGLTFNMPAELSVDGPGIDADILVLTARNDGSGLRMVPRGDHKASGQILHFSPGTAATREDLDRLVGGRQADAIAEVDKVLNDKGIQVPEPPSVALGCAADSNSDAESKAQAAVDQYVETALNPERALIAKLYGISGERELLSGDNPLSPPGRGATPDVLWNKVSALQDRLVKKAQLLLNNPAYRTAEKMRAVDAAVLAVAYSVSQFAGTTNDTATALMDSLAANLTSVVDELLNDIIDNHNYENEALVVGVAKDAALLGADVDADKLLARLQNAMLFRLEPNYGLTVGVDAWNAQGTIQLVPTAGQSEQELWRGIGRLSSTYTGQMDLTTPSFEEGAIMSDWDICERKANLIFQSFGPVGGTADEDTITIEGDTFPETTFPVKSIMGEMWKTTFAKYFVPRTGEAGFDVYSFPMELHNKAEVAADFSFDGSVEGIISVFHLKLVHTPKRSDVPVPDPGFPFKEQAPSLGGTPAPSESNLPQDVPVYPGAENVQSTAGQMTLMQTQDTVEQVVAFYEDQMKSNGWTSMPGSDIGEGSNMQWMKGTKLAVITAMVQDNRTVITIQIIGQ
jgi:hypothetical protein